MSAKVSCTVLKTSTLGDQRAEFICRHEILFEGFPPSDPKAKAPLCLEGERACPPEDCGGPPGYGNYLDAIADPQHEQHEEMLEWRGPFDPSTFDAKKATKEMRKVK
jgi:hypothetical protein